MVGGVGTGEIETVRNTGKRETAGDAQRARWKGESAWREVV